MSIKKNFVTSRKFSIVKTFYSFLLTFMKKYTKSILVIRIYEELLSLVYRGTKQYEPVCNWYNTRSILHNINIYTIYNVSDIISKMFLWSVSQSLKSIWPFCREMLLMFVRVQKHTTENVFICVRLNYDKFIIRSPIVSLSQFINIRFLVKWVSWINSFRLTVTLTAILWTMTVTLNTMN